MYTETEGIVIKQVKAANGRQMLTIFTKKYGKINAGTNISTKGKNKTTLAIKPFTYGKYALYKNGDFYNVNGAETIKSHYRIGEDVDKYLNAAYILELTDKALQENYPQPKVFNLLEDCLKLLETRTKKYETLSIAYEVKLIKELGVMPELEKCVECGSRENLTFFDVKNGGVICQKCAQKKMINLEEALNYNIEISIITILKYFLKNSLHSLANLALEDEKLEKVKKIINEYEKYHLDIGKLKSEEFLLDV